MRDRPLSLFIYGLFAVVILGLFYTQVIRYVHYSRLSKNNVIRIIPIEGPRGTIFDRRQAPVVTSRLSFDVAVVYQELSDMDAFIGLLERVLGISGKDIARSLNKAMAKPYAPVTIVEDIPKEKALVLDEASLDVPGLVIETKSKREYPYGLSGSHLFGYLSQITEEELDRFRNYGYQMRDLVGRSGLERYYDRYLTGVGGGFQIQVDNRGRQVRVLGMKEPESGKDLHLTIDMGLQVLCDKLLGDKSGAIVVMDPRNGAVLALSSHPAFDPNAFIKPSMSSIRMQLLQDKKGKPLIDRAISGLYAPGSVFKVVTASAALEPKKITSFTRFVCNGTYRVGSHVFNCWKKEGHGTQDLANGIMNSCNVYFYNIGRLAGVDAIETYSKMYGYGKPTGIDLPDEASGLVPGRVWKRVRYNDIWYEGETANYAIGQGYLLVTPIQVMNMMAVVANGGYLVRPYVVSRISNTDISGHQRKRVVVSDGTIRKIKEGLIKVVNDEGGTGKRARVEGAFVAGKTGTAQNPQGRTHAWFTGFAPYNYPKVCIVVFVEHGGKGGVEPAEIAHGIFEEAKQKGYL